MMEEIVARLGLDPTNFKGGLSAADQGMKALRQTVSDFASVLAGAFTVGKMVEVAREAIQYASAITDSAIATRTGVEEYQVLTGAAREAGASIKQLDMALVSATTAGVEAAQGLATYKRAFDVLNIAVGDYNKLSSEERLVAIGRAYLDAGRSAEAFSAITDILGTRAGPRLIEVLERLGKDGFGALSEEMRAAGLVMDKEIAENLDRLGDKWENWKIVGLNAVSKVVVGFELLIEKIKGASNIEAYLNVADPRQAEMRTLAIQQLAEEDAAVYAERMKNLGPAAMLPLARIIGDAFKKTAEDEEAIQKRMEDLLLGKLIVEKQLSVERAEQIRAAEKQAALEAHQLTNAQVLERLENGRALLRLAEMSNREKLVSLEEMHRQAVEALAAAQADTTSTQRDQEGIVKTILDLEKQIGATKGKIADDDRKAGEDRLKKEQDLAALLVEQAKLQDSITQSVIDRYAKSPEELASGGGVNSSTSTLAGLVTDYERAAAAAADRFSELAEARAAAMNDDVVTEDERRAVAERQTDFDLAEQRRASLEGDIATAQGKKGESPELVELKGVRKEVEELRKQLNSA